MRTGTYRRPNERQQDSSGVKKKKPQMKERPEFAQKLIQWRKQQGLTMKQLSTQLQVSESYISRLEAGERHPSREFVMSLAPVLFPEGNPLLQDELLIAAGFTPLRIEKFIDHADSVNIYQRLVNHNPQDFRAYLFLIVALIKEGKYETARTKIATGMELFDNSVQLQSLLSSLELSKKNYSEALAYQWAAIRDFEKETDKRLCGTTYQDLLLNLGVIHFIKGYEHIDESLNAERCQDYAKQESEQKEALKHLQEAQDCFKKGLAIAPGDIYILDEYARTTFNLACIAPPSKAPELWQETIQGFQKVIYSPLKQDLSYQDVIQSAIFLAHAYSKSGHFIEAEHNINLIEACLPENWLIHYVKACFFSLKYEYTGEAMFLEQAEIALGRSMACKDPANMAALEAQTDPDIKGLRQARGPSFDNLLQLENLI